MDEPVSLSDFIRSFSDVAPEGSIASAIHATLGLEGGPQAERSGGVGSADVGRGDTASGHIVKLIACCYEGEEKRISIDDALSAAAGQTRPHIVILIGPEGDFSREEVALALECGFKPVHLGPSRLRTETAALAAVAAVYFHWSNVTDCYTDD